MSVLPACSLCLAHHACTFRPSEHTLSPFCITHRLLHFYVLCICNLALRDSTCLPVRECEAETCCITLCLSCCTKTAPACTELLGFSCVQPAPGSLHPHTLCCATLFVLLRRDGFCLLGIACVLQCAASPEHVGQRCAAQAVEAQVCVCVCALGKFL
jgi:hypothetical protein